MPNCELAIRLDRVDRAYRAGDRVRGRVEVRAFEIQSCRKLTLTWGWETRGAGNRYAVEDSLTLAEDVSWESEIVSYPFEFSLPAGPLSYAGQLISVVWYARAAADLPMALDPTVREEFRVLPSANLPHVYLGPTYAGPVGAGFAREPRGWLLGAIGFLFLLGALLITARDLLEPTLSPQDAFGIGVGCVVLAAAGLASFLYTSRTNRLLGRVITRIDRQSIAPGEALRWSLRMRPTKPVAIRRVRASLIGRERVVDGSGRGRSIQSVRIHESEVVLEPRREVAGGEEFVLEAELAIPDAAAYTFAAPSNDVRWWVAIEVEIPGWPDVRRDYDLTICPAGAAPAMTSVAP